MGATRKHGNAAKTSKWDKKLVVEELVKRRLNGESMSSLRKYLVEVHGVSDRMIDNYFRDCLKRINEIYGEGGKEKLVDDFNETMARLDTLYENSESSKDKLAVIKEMSELRGLKKQKVDITSGGQPIQIIINKDSDKK